MSQRFASAYFGGAVAALVCSVTVWLLARADLLSAIGVGIAPALTWSWLSRRILWGSLWGLGYPLMRRSVSSPVRAGLLLSLAPSTAQLLYFSPAGGHGLLGLDLGLATPLVVLSANALWGWVLAHTASATGGR